MRRSVRWASVSAMRNLGDDDVIKRDASRAESTLKVAGASTMSATTLASSAILSYPQGPLAATIELLTEIAEKTGNAKVLHAVRYLTGEAVGKADMARTCQYVC
jgi:hypothetical protein